jgi:hypothetical protein
MREKVTVTLIVFLFPALIAPLLVLAFLTRLPGGFGAFFTDYAFAFLWGFYLLLAVGSVVAYRYFKRRAEWQASLAEAEVHDAADESPARMAESQQE